MPAVPTTPKGLKTREHILQAARAVFAGVVVGGLLVLIGGALGPETRDVDMGDRQLSAPTEPASSTTGP